jgi:hypothetical protein
MAGMKTLLNKFKLALINWLREPFDEMDRKQERNDVRTIFTKPDKRRTWFG